MDFEPLATAKSRVFDEREKDTLTAMDNVARILRKRGDATRADELDDEVLRLRLRVLGPEHPHTITSMAIAAGKRRDRGDLEEAQRQFETVLAICSRVHGPTHLETLLITQHLAGTLQAQGKLEEARELEERVLQEMIRLFGAGHRYTLLSAGNLAHIKDALGDRVGASQLRRSIEQEGMTRMILSEPSTNSDKGETIAQMLEARGDHKAVLRELERVVAARAQNFGPLHPMTKAAEAELAAKRKAMEEKGQGD